MFKLNDEMLNSIFDELKEVQYYKEMTDFKSFMMQNILKNLQKAEAYLERKRMEHFCEYAFS